MTVMFDHVITEPHLRPDTEPGADLTSTDADSFGDHLDGNAASSAWVGAAAG
jgi:hypothetical protein